MKKLLAITLAFALLLPVLAGCESALASQDTPETTISQENALEIALTDAGLTKDQIHDLDIDLDRENGVLQYEVEFEKDNKDYDYVILAETGEILHKEVPKATESTPVTTQPEVTEPATPAETKPAATESVKTLTKDEALAIALADAGLKKSQIHDLDIELDKERGVWEYEIDFEVGTADYEYDIHAETGKIIRKETPSSVSIPATESSQKISRDEAISIALNHAKLSKSDVRDLEAELDKENGVQIYEVSFESGGYDYEYDINAETGKILRSAKERD